MAKAKKLPSGNWRCKANYTDEYGIRKSKSFTADTKKEAEYAAAAFLMEQEHKAKPENKTLRQLAEEFLADRSEILSPSTIRGYRSIVNNAFSEIIDVRLERLTSPMYQRAVNAYAKTHSPKSVLSAHVFYNTLLRKEGITVGENANLPQREKNEIAIPSAEELNTFLANVRDTRLYLYCLFSSCAGLRKSELIALQWDDVDVEKQTVRINKAKVRDEFGDYVLKTTKTYSSSRTVHMPQILIDALQKVDIKDGLIFKDTPKAYESLYQRQCKRWSFPYNFHALRHFYASVLLLSGMPNRYAQERMGHGSDNMLKQVYQHVFGSKQKGYDSLVDDFFQRELLPTTTQ